MNEELLKQCKKKNNMFRKYAWKLYLNLPPLFAGKNFITNFLWNIIMTRTNYEVSDELIGEKWWKDCEKACYFS